MPNKKQTPDSLVSVKGFTEGFSKTSYKAKKGDPLERAFYIARSNKNMPPRRLAKQAGIRVADAKRILGELSQ